jgi:hypothetical protein
MPEPTPQVDLTDDVLMKMMHDPNFTTTFPFLATTIARATARKAGCGGCAKKNRSRAVNFNLVRRQLAEMPAERKARLKQILDTKQIVIRYTQASGQSMKLKF